MDFGPELLVQPNGSQARQLLVVHERVLPQLTCEPGGIMEIGIIGHRMRDGIDWDWVRSQINAIIRQCVGKAQAGLWTALATGADTIAAEEALGAGLRLNVIIPHDDYDDMFSKEDREHFRALRARAAVEVAMPALADREEAYLAAGKAVVERSALLIAVWDGKEAAGKDNVSDIVGFARETDVIAIWLDTEAKLVRRA